MGIVLQTLLTRQRILEGIQNRGALGGEEGNDGHWQRAGGQLRTSWHRRRLPASSHAPADSLQLHR